MYALACKSKSVKLCQDWLQMQSQTEQASLGLLYFVSLNYKTPFEQDGDDHSMESHVASRMYKEGTFMERLVSCLATTFNSKGVEMQQISK